MKSCQSLIEFEFEEFDFTQFSFVPSKQNGQFFTVFALIQRRQALNQCKNGERCVSVNYLVHQVRLDTG